MAERLQQPGNIKDRLGQLVLENEGLETRACHKWNKVGHIARDCPQKREGGPVNNVKTVGDKC